MKKLDMRGVTHDVMIVAFVVIFAIGGVAYLVASHADSCNSLVSGTVSSPTSSPVTTVSCARASSGPVTGPAAGGPVSSILAGACILSSVPANPVFGQQLRPSVTFTNTGTTAFTPSGTSNMETFADSGDLGGKGGPVTSSAVGSQQKVTVATGSEYTVPYSSASVRRIVFSVTNTNPRFSCNATATLPTQSSSTSSAGTGTTSTTGSTGTTKTGSGTTATGSPTAGGTNKSSSPSGSSASKSSPVSQPAKKRNVVQGFFHWIRFSLF